MKHIKLWAFLGLMLTSIVLLAGCGQLAGNGNNNIGAPLSGKMLSGAALNSSAAGLTDDEKNTILKNHNDARAAKNLSPLVWDDNLASVAQSWAEQMAATDNFDHNPNRGNTGENIFGIGTGGDAVSAVVADWVSEVQWYHIDTNTCTAPPDKYCGHYTQVMWSTTTAVGCGKASSSTWNYIVCDYSPPGNMNGQRPYDPTVNGDTNPPRQSGSGDNPNPSINPGNQDGETPSVDPGNSDQQTPTVDPGSSDQQTPSDQPDNYDNSSPDSQQSNYDNSSSY